MEIPPTIRTGGVDKGALTVQQRAQILALVAVYMRAVFLTAIAFHTHSENPEGDLEATCMRYALVYHMHASNAIGPFVLRLLRGVFTEEGSLLDLAVAPHERFFVETTAQVVAKSMRVALAQRVRAEQIAFILAYAFGIHEDDSDDEDADDEFEDSDANDEFEEFEEEDEEEEEDEFEVEWERLCGTRLPARIGSPCSCWVCEERTRVIEMVPAINEEALDFGGILGNEFSSAFRATFEF